MNEARLSVRQAATADLPSDTPGAADRPRFWRSLAGIVDRPRATLQEIYAQPRWMWLGPVLLLVISLVALNLISSPYSAEIARDQIRRQIESMSEEQAALLSGQLDRFSSPLFVGLTASVTGAIGLLLALLTSAAILYFGNLVVGGDINFGPLLTLVVWTWVPFGLRNIVETGFVYTRGALIYNEGLSWLVSVGDMTKDTANIGYFVLGFAQVFVVWHLILVWAGARGAGKLPASKATFLVLFYAILAMAVRWIPVIVGRLFTL